MKYPDGTGLDGFGIRTQKHHKTEALHGSEFVALIFQPILWRRWVWSWRLWRWLVILRDLQLSSERFRAGIPWKSLKFTYSWSSKFWSTLYHLVNNWLHTSFVILRSSATFRIRVGMSWIASHPALSKRRHRLFLCLWSIAFGACRIQRPPGNLRVTWPDCGSCHLTTHTVWAYPLKMHFK